MMKIEVEINEVDRKHEGRRMRSASREKELLSSIAERGIEEPLQGVRSEAGAIILLDGFKRLRCATRIGLGVVPFISLGSDETMAIIQILRASNAKSLTMLEQAAFVEELKQVHHLGVAEIASRLSRSKAWVLVRLQTLSAMSERTSKAILSGHFPLYSYLYTLHPFRRLTGDASQKKEVDEFVSLVSGKGLSTRDIEILADPFFRGGDRVREQLRKGDLGWCLQELKEKARSSQQLSQGQDLCDVEKRVLRDLEILQGCIGRLSLKLTHPELGKAAFLAQAELLSEGVLSRIERFTAILRGFYDRSRQA